MSGVGPQIPQMVGRGLNLETENLGTRGPGGRGDILSPMGCGLCTGSPDVTRLSSGRIWRLGCDEPKDDASVATRCHEKGSIRRVKPASAKSLVFRV